MRAPSRACAGSAALAALALAAGAAGAAVAAAQEVQPAERTVTKVRFRGNDVLDGYTLAAAIATSASSWNYGWFGRGLTSWLPFGERRLFDETEFRRDVFRLQLFYRQHGHYEARIDTVVRRGAREVDVTFRIVEGPPVIVDSVAIAGLGDVADPRDALRRLPLRAGRTFDRFLFEASADTLLTFVRNRGRPFAAVYRGYAVDRVSRLAVVEFVVDPGPRTRVGAIAVEGHRRVGERTVRRALAVREGDLFRQNDLVESQRSLYQSDLFRFASVAVARDSLVGGQDTLVRLGVRVTEAPPARLGVSAGYGTIDCLRVSSTARLRGFLGAARLLDVAGRLSKIGFAWPADTGLGKTLCPALTNDRFSDELNYLLSATLTQPAPFTPRSQLALSFVAERRSEFNAYLFQSVGGTVALKLGLGRTVPVTVSYRLADEQTDADDATYCVFFNQCEQSTIEVFKLPVRNGSVSASATWTNTDSPFEPTHGHVIALEGTLAARALGSDVVFTRLLGQATSYQRLGGRRSLALRVLGGIVHAGVARFDSTTLRYVPPSYRFYLGGPTNVRGFGRNEMGPLVYVVDTMIVTTPQGGGPPDTTFQDLRSSPTGSNAVILANAELRVPTPIWAGRLALTAYVDAAQLWQQQPDTTPATRRQTKYVPGGVRLTPGIGLQLSTPLGPMRLDAAYNGYGTQPGPLYQIVGTGPASRLEQVPLAGDFQRAPSASFLARIQWHFSVGLAF